ncbi:CPBP family intramembrane glutamate endopeptidase, partial [Bacillus sp. SIMBA_161]
LLFSLLIQTSARFYISSKELTHPINIYVINGCAMPAGCLLLLLIIQKRRLHFKEIGLRKGSLSLWVFPIFFIEAIPCIAG